LRTGKSKIEIHSYTEITAALISFIVIAFLNFALEYAIRNVQENQVGLKLNRTHLPLVYADGVNLVGDNIDTIKKNTGTLADTGKEVGIKVNAEKTKYMLLFHCHKVGQNHDIKIANRSFENVAQFRYLGMTVTNQNLIQEKIKRRLNSVQNLLSSRLLSENVNIRI
jgi:hypothetical protein